MFATTSDPIERSPVVEAHPFKASTILKMFTSQRPKRSRHLERKSIDEAYVRRAPEYRNGARPDNSENDCLSPRTKMPATVNRASRELVGGIEDGSGPSAAAILNPQSAASDPRKSGTRP